MPRVPAVANSREPGAGGAPAGSFRNRDRARGVSKFRGERTLVMNNVIYIVGLVVVVIAVLSFFGLR